MADFPAAHSMDTTWYAVDRAGRVAQFSSGEEGSVPWAACRASWDDVYDELVVARIAATQPLDEQRRLTAALEATRDPVERRLIGDILAGDDAAREVYADWVEANGGAWNPRARSVYQVGKLTREIPADSLPETWSGIVAFATADDRAMFRDQHAYAAARLGDIDARLGIAHALAVEDLHQYAFDDFWGAGVIRAAFLVERALEPRHVGLYEYACGFSGPYQLRTTPRDPLLISELPEPVRGRIGALEMSRVTFGNSDEIDPERFFDCQRYRT